MCYDPGAPQAEPSQLLPSPTAGAQLEFREPQFTEINSGSNTLKRQSSRAGEPVKEVPRVALVEPAARYRFSRSQPSPRMCRASELDTFVSQASVQFSEEDVGGVGKQEDGDMSPPRKGVYSE